MDNVNKFRTLVINADGIPLSVISWKRALCLIMEAKATQLEFYHNIEVRDGRGRGYPVPAVISLHKFVRRNYQRVACRRHNILIRDNYTCSYCNKKFSSEGLTIDHVIPKSKWKKTNVSPTNWTNVVAACHNCNRKKANHDCGVVMMYPRVHPREPLYSEIFIGTNYVVPEEWTLYLIHLPHSRV